MWGVLLRPDWSWCGSEAQRDPNIYTGYIQAQQIRGKDIGPEIPTDAVSKDKGTDC